MPKMENTIAEYDKHIEKLEQQNAKFIKALQNIKLKCELSSMHAYTSDILNIVTKALKK